MGVAVEEGSPVFFTNVYAAFAEDAEDELVENIKSRRIMKRQDAYTEKFAKKKEEQTYDVSGEHRLRSLIFIVNNCYKWLLNRFQRRFIAIIIKSLAPYIVGDDWDIVGPALCQEFGWTDGVKMQAIATTARRVGKSTAVSIAQCAVALVMPTSNQATFSTSKRASYNLRDAVIKTLFDSKYHEYLAGRAMKAERMEIYNIFGDPTQKSQLNFYPQNKQISVTLFIIYNIRVWILQVL